MSSVVWRIGFIATLCAMAGSSRSADWVPEMVTRYGGVYATDCSNPSAPRLRADTESLQVEVANRRMTGRKVQISVNPFGSQQPLPGVEVVTLLSEVRGGHELSFWVHRDTSGQFVEIEADKAVMSALGKDLVGKRFLDCDATRSERAATEAKAQVAKARADAVTLAHGQPGKARFRAAYVRALGPSAKEAWLLSQVARPTDATTVTVAGTQYQQFTGCKPHDCGDNNALVLYAPQTDAVVGKIFVRQQSRYIGSPSAAEIEEIERLWRIEWRQGR